MAGAILTAAVDLKAGITRYDVTWISDAAGNVSGSTFVIKMGTLMAVEFIPAVGAIAPDNLYDVDCLDDLGVSLFDNGAGATIGLTLSGTAASYQVPLLGLTGVTIYRRWYHGGPVQPTVAGAGDTNSGTIRIYVLTGVL